MNLKEAKSSLDKARADYHALADTGTAKARDAASDAVHDAQKALSDAIADGAKPCPFCKVIPHGIEHVAARGRAIGVEYEIGCLGCPSFVHTDGTKRMPYVRGGTLPRHAVDAWNEGPDSWMIAAPVDAPTEEAPAVEASTTEAKS